MKCPKCKEGYINYNEQCISCSNEIRNCQKCHYDNTKSKLFCDECQNGYSINSNKDSCISKNCESYPEISEGCILCENKFEEYKSQKKCHKCKSGFFKTKDEKCINCRTEKYGGPDCISCKYILDLNQKETNDITCDFCPEKYFTKNSEGKCYNCENNIPNCEVCEFIKNNDNNSEKLI